MNEREAQEIIRMVESNWRFDLGAARSLWRTELLRFDAGIVTKAVARLARTQGRRVDLVDLLAVAESMSPEIASTKDVCPTCSADYLVVVSLRAPNQTSWMAERGISPSDQKIEEYAPCPDCNAAANTAFSRHDGVEVTCPDPGAVRMMMGS